MHIYIYIYIYIWMYSVGVWRFGSIQGLWVPESWGLSFFRFSNWVSRILQEGRERRIAVKFLGDIGFRSLKWLRHLLGTPDGGDLVGS